MVFCHVTLHLWGCVFRMFPDLRRLPFTDDGNIIGRFSQDLKLITSSKSVFKLDGNLDFNLVKTLDTKTGLLTGLLGGKQDWKCHVPLIVTCCGSKSLKVILIDSDFGYYPLLNPLVTL